MKGAVRPLLFLGVFMKIREVLTQVDDLYANAFSEEDKLQWLQQIEEKIYKELVLTHHEPVEMTEFDDDDNELIAPAPYDSLYINYIIANINKYNNETVRYNNAMIIFNQEYQEFANWYNRTKMPLSSKEK